MGHRTLRWHKGHGTENDFVVLPDFDGVYHADLGTELVRLLCDRRRGVGADGVLRAVRTAAEPAAEAYADRAEWFMDFRNADGSVGEMCGNGIRVFARYLADAGLVDPNDELPVATRGGLKRIAFGADGRLSVDMEFVRFPRVTELWLSLRERRWPGVAVDVSNPHAMTFVGGATGGVVDLAQLGDLSDAGWTAEGNAFPAGVNLEFAVRRSERHLDMRVLERGVGETRSCGTGAVAVAAATARVEGVDLPRTYRIDVPGGSLDVHLDRDWRATLTGPAEVRLTGEILV